MAKHAEQLLQPYLGRGSATPVGSGRARAPTRRPTVERHGVVKTFQAGAGSVQALAGVDLASGTASSWR